MLMSKQFSDICFRCKTIFPSRHTQVLLSTELISVHDDKSIGIEYMPNTIEKSVANTANILEKYRLNYIGSNTNTEILTTLPNASEYWTLSTPCSEKK